MKIQKQWVILILVTAMSNSLVSGQATETNILNVATNLQAFYILKQ